MYKSTNLEFAFLEAAQAAKHLTVNDALEKIDKVSQLIIQSTDGNVPITANEGHTYYLPTTDPDHPNQIAIYSNGGYLYVTPKNGWRAYVIDKGCLCLFSQNKWVPVGEKAYIEFTQDLFGASVQTIEFIPEKSIVSGITARVVEEITGSGIASWSVGVSNNDNLYGSGLWLGLNGWSKGLTGTPITYWQDTPLIIKPDAGSFTSGKIKFYIYLQQLDVPPEV